MKFNNGINGDYAPIVYKGIVQGAVGAFRIVGIFAASQQVVWLPSTLLVPYWP